MDNKAAVQAFIDQGNALYSQGRLDAAISRYIQAIEKDPNCGDAFNNWGFALSAQGKLSEAIEKYARATEANPSFSHAYYNWGNSLRRLGRYDEAISKYKKAIESNPSYSLAYNNWGVTLDAQGKYEEAIQKYSKAAEINPNYSQAYNNWGFALDAQGKYDEAITKYAKATSIEPNYSDAYDNWGNALSAQGKYPEAILRYTKAISLNPNNSEAYYNWGLALYFQMRYDDAVAKFTKAVECNPNYFLAYYSWGLTLYQQNRFADVMYIRIQALKIIENDPQSQMELTSLVNSELGRTKNKLANARIESERKHLQETMEAMNKVLEFFLQKPKAPGQEQPRTNMPSTQQITQTPPQMSLSAPIITPTQVSPTQVSPNPLSSSTQLSPTQLSPTQISPTYDQRDAQPEQRQMFAEPQLNEYHKFLQGELKYLFIKAFVQQGRKLEEKYDALISLVNWVASSLPPLSRISSGPEIFPFLSKMAPDGIKLEDIIQIKRVNKVAQRFIGQFTSVEEVEQIIDTLTENLTLMRREDLFGNYNKPVSFSVSDKAKRGKERGLLYSKGNLMNKSEEYAFLDYCVLVLLFFLEGLKVGKYMNDVQKVDSTVKVISMKMKEYIGKQKSNPKMQPEWWNTL